MNMHICFFCKSYRPLEGNKAFSADVGTCVHPTVSKNATMTVDLTQPACECFEPAVHLDEVEITPEIEKELEKFRNDREASCVILTSKTLPIDFLDNKPDDHVNTFISRCRRKCYSFEKLSRKYPTLSFKHAFRSVRESDTDKGCVIVYACAYKRVSKLSLLLDIAYSFDKPTNPKKSRDQLVKEALLRYLDDEMLTEEISMLLIQS